MSTLSVALSVEKLSFSPVSSTCFTKSYSCEQIGGLRYGGRLPLSIVEAPGGKLCSTIYRSECSKAGPSLTYGDHLRCPNNLERATRLFPSMNVTCKSSSGTAEAAKDVAESVGFVGLHHVGLLCQSVDRSLDFYCGVLGLELNDDRDRPEVKLPYGGAWLWVGTSMIHLMELPNPDPVTGRPSHGGRDRHSCFAIRSVAALAAALERAGHPFTMSQSGRAAIFVRDPDGNALEFFETSP